MNATLTIRHMGAIEAAIGDGQRQGLRIESDKKQKGDDMGRSKGEAFHKNKRKEYLRIRCRGWTIREDILIQLSCASNAMGVCESRIVEIAIKNILTKTSDKIQNPAKIFTKN